MKITHTTLATPAKKFSEITDLVEVADLVKGTYDPDICNCIGICNILAGKYSNLEPVEVDTWLYDGGAHASGHIVCKIEGTDLLLDPTGDYVEYDNTVKLKKSMVPWIYKQIPGTKIYLSQDHSPFVPRGEDSKDFTNEWEVLKYTSNPFYYRFRAITLK